MFLVYQVSIFHTFNTVYLLNRVQVIYVCVSWAFLNGEIAADFMTSIIICLLELMSQVMLPLKQIQFYFPVYSWIYDFFYICYPCGFRKRKGLKNEEKL